MKALILVGGFGTRLRPLTYTRPKPLLPVANRSHVEHLIALLARHGVDDVTLLTSYMAEAFAGVRSWAEARGLRVSVAVENEPLGTAGAVRNAGDVGTEPFFVVNGDVLTDADLSRLVDLHRRARARATLLLKRVGDPSAYGVVPTDPEGRVLGFIEKPEPGTAPTDAINAGVYVFEPDVLERIPEGRAMSAERELFPALAADGVLYATALGDYWIDIGTPATYLQANLDALSGAFRTDAVPAPGPDAVVAGEGSLLAPDARISSACLGAGCRVGPGAEVTRCVLLPGATVEAGATVVDSILGEGAFVAGGCALSGAVLADGDRAGDRSGGSR